MLAIRKAIPTRKKVQPDRQAAVGASGGTRSATPGCPVLSYREIRKRLMGSIDTM